VVNSMSRNRKKTQRRSAAKRSVVAAVGVSVVAPEGPFDTETAYAKACSLACQGQHDDAWLVYMDLKRAIASWDKGSRLLALIHNDLAVLAAVDGRFDEARADRTCNAKLTGHTS
jgi:hypothetical protein